MKTKYRGTLILYQRGRRLPRWIFYDRHINQYLACEWIENKVIIVNCSCFGKDHNIYIWRERLGQLICCNGRPSLVWRVSISKEGNHKWNTEWSMKNAYLSKRVGIQREHAKHEGWRRGQAFRMTCKQKSYDQSPSRRSPRVGIVKWKWSECVVNVAYSVVGTLNVHKCL